MKSIYIKSFAVLLLFSLPSTNSIATDVEADFRFTPFDEILATISRDSEQSTGNEQREYWDHQTHDAHDLNGLIERAGRSGPEAIDAITRIQSLNTDQAVEALCELAQSTNPSVSRTAISGLVNMEASLAVPRMISLLDSPRVNSMGKALLLGCLESHPGKNTELAIVKQLKNPDLERFALSALGSVGTERSRHVLKQYAASESGEYMPIIEYALKRIEARLSSNGEGCDMMPEDSAALPELVTDGIISDDEKIGAMDKEPLATKPAHEDHSQKIEDMLNRIRVLEKNMLDIQNQVFQVGEVQKAMAVYANRLSRTKDELVATGHNDYALLPEEQAKDLLHQDALQDPSVQEAKQKAR